MPHFYPLVSGDRAQLADALGADPFAISPAELIERVLAAGYVPDVQRDSPDPHPMTGVVRETSDADGRDYLIGLDEAFGRVTVQEMTAEALLGE